MKLLLFLIAVATYLAIMAIALALSWFIVCGIIYLICLCFGLEFSLLIATGIWLIMLLLGWLGKLLD